MNQAYPEIFADRLHTPLSLQLKPSQHIDGNPQLQIILCVSGDDPGGIDLIHEDIREDIGIQVYRVFRKLFLKKIKCPFFTFGYGPVKFQRISKKERVIRDLICHIMKEITEQIAVKCINVIVMTVECALVYICFMTEITYPDFFQRLLFQHGDECVFQISFCFEDARIL
ncbi:MAG: hypothetical protein IJV58_01385 [Oscillospiraceae bacterium]|nr:hypothetical protein [Oscillospiraceae bacterium]